jgi:hypothetical protein
MLDERGMVKPSDADGVWRLSSLNSIATTAAVTNSMLSYLQSSACCALASTVMTPVGLSILSLR